MMNNKMKSKVELLLALTLEAQAAGHNINMIVTPKAVELYIYEGNNCTMKWAATTGVLADIPTRFTSPCSSIASIGGLIGIMEELVTPMQTA